MFAALLVGLALGTARGTPFGVKSVLELMIAPGVAKEIVHGRRHVVSRERIDLDNALVGVWPVVVIEDGKARIKEYKSIPDWWNKHKDLMIKHMEALDQMYYQRS